jgi:hypothetical protein
VCTVTMGDIAIEPVEAKEGAMGIGEAPIDMLGEIAVKPKLKLDENGNVKKVQKQ